MKRTHVNITHEHVDYIQTHTHRNIFNYTRMRLCLCKCITFILYNESQTEVNSCFFLMYCIRIYTSRYSVAHVNIAHEHVDDDRHTHTTQTDSIITDNWSLELQLELVAIACVRRVAHVTYASKILGDMSNTASSANGTLDQTTITIT